MPALRVEALPASGEIAWDTVGHQSREDDVPAIGSAPDGSLWVAWLSFDGRRDDVALRRHDARGWSNIHWVPGTSGDSWLPQVVCDAESRVWVIWTQQVDGNWDLYARSFDAARQEWGPLERWTTDPLPDCNPRAWSDGRGRGAVVWQGFRGRHSNIFLKRLDGGRWSDTVRVTERDADDWEPAVALDKAGMAWVAYDSYARGNYDVFLRRVRGNRPDGDELPVAATARFEARPSVAVDAADRVWVAWESGEANWGKDTGALIRERQPGAPLGAFRRVRLRCLEGERWKEPEAEPASVFGDSNAYRPAVWSDGRGSVWLAAALRKVGPTRAVFPQNPGYWELWAAHLEGSGWSEPFALPSSKGRGSSRFQGTAVGTDLWAAWATDNRAASYYHRPVRQQVQAGRIAARDGQPPRLAAPREETVAARPGHAAERADVAALRAYRTVVGGRTAFLARGDLHRHTELSWDEGGSSDGSLEDLYRYMIDAAALDFGAATDHQGGAWPYWWHYNLKLADMYAIAGTYVPLYGYERSASYPFGHRNLVFPRRSQARVTPFFLKDGVALYRPPLSPEGDEPADETGELARNDTRLLYEEVRQGDGLSIPHTSAMNNFGTDWADNDPALEPVVEIFQGCRMSSEAAGAPWAFDTSNPRFAKQYNPGGMVSNAWAKGYRLGVIASSDHFSTHLSYAMVFTHDLSREGILEALRKRHAYGATDNILLDVRMGEHFMGDAFRSRRNEPLRVKVRGTGPVAIVEVIQDGRVVYATEPKRPEVEFQFTGAAPSDAGRHYLYVRVRQADGMLAWSSPMFLEN